MKKYIKILMTAVFVSLISSCIGLDTAPYDRETDLTFWSKDSLSALKALNTCYINLATMDEQLWSDCMTDNAYTKQPSAYTQSIGNGSYSTADNYVKSVWDTKYAGIRACNEVLNNIGKLQHLNPGLRKRYIGEAKFIRAYHYYQLYTKFGAVPYFTNVLSVKESQQISRTPKEQVVNNVLAELNEIINDDDLPSSYGSDDKGRITKWAAMSLKAKVYLFDSNWQRVKEITDTIIKQGGFKLFPSYSGLFEVANEGNCEVILDAQYRSVSRESNIMYSFLPPSMGGYSQLSPLQSLVDSYIMLNGKSIQDPASGYDENNPYVNRDPRLAATIMYTGNYYTLSDGTKKVINCQKGEGQDGYNVSSDCTATGYYLKKWWDKTYRATLQSGLNPILVRYADILLMNAEANMELGTFDATVWNNTIRPIRVRAGFTENGALDFPSSMTKDELREVIRNERRCELAMEGLRREDIIRWKIADKVLNGWAHGFKTGETVGTDNGYVRVEQRQFDANKHYLWPIPQYDRDLNKNLDQNPNW